MGVGRTDGEKENENMVTYANLFIGKLEELQKFLSFTQIFETKTGLVAVKRLVM